MLRVPLQELPPFIGGFVGIIVFWVVRYYVNHKSPTIKTAFIHTIQINSLALFFGNLVIVGFGTVIAIYAILYQAGIIELSAIEIEAFHNTLGALIFVVWILFGVFLGGIAIYITQFCWSIIKSIQKKTKDKKESEIRIIAYHVWKSEGCPKDRDLEHWSRAEKLWKEPKK